MAIRIKVSQRQRRRREPHRVALGGLERAVAIAQQNAQAGRSIVRAPIAPICHREVQDAIAVQVAHGNRSGIVARGVTLGRLKGAVAVTQQDTHRAAESYINDRKVDDAIAIKIPHCHVTGI